MRKTNDENLVILTLQQLGLPSGMIWLGIVINLVVPAVELSTYGQ
jgi:hypothetical protein